MGRLYIALIFITFSSWVFSDVASAEIHADSAYSDAFILVSAKFLAAAVVYYVLTLGLRGSLRDTAVKNGRWVGAWLSTITIINTSTLHKSTEDFLFTVAIMTVVWFAVGFALGYIWRKFKNIPIANADSMNVKSNSNVKAFLPILVLIGLGMVFGLFVYNNGIGLNTKAVAYDLFPSCKNQNKDCKQSNTTITFKVDKERSQVVVVATTPTEKLPTMTKLNNCVVADEHNWQCEENPINYNDGHGNWFSDIPYRLIMVNDDVTMTDSVVTSSNNYKVETKTYYGEVFVRK